MAVVPVDVPFILNQTETTKRERIPCARGFSILLSKQRRRKAPNLQKSKSGSSFHPSAERAFIFIRFSCFQSKEKWHFIEQFDQWQVENYTPSPKTGFRRPEDKIICFAFSSCSPKRKIWNEALGKWFVFFSFLSTYGIYNFWWQVGRLFRICVVSPLWGLGRIVVCAIRLFFQPSRDLRVFLCEMF